MISKNTPERTEFTFPANGKIYHAIRYKKKNDLPYSIAVRITNPDPTWTAQNDGLQYYLLHAHIFDKCIITKQISKENIIKERIKKLWNESNYVRNYNAMRML